MNRGDDERKVKNTRIQALESRLDSPLYLFVADDLGQHAQLFRTPVYPLSQIKIKTVFTSQVGCEDFMR